MLKKKCPACEKRIDRKFNYCPFCGEAVKKIRQEDYGMLGIDDRISQQPIQNEIKLPFGMGKIVDQLVKQLERQMGDMDINDLPQGMPKGFKIKVTTGNPQMKQVVQNNEEERKPVYPEFEVSNKEKKRRDGLERVDAESRVKRLADRIIYEIDAPGVSKKEEVVITELASGLEIKIYSKDKCYVKFIPLKVELIGYRISKDKVLVELKN